ncbi:MAG TPA: hypothetical protein VHI55_13355 [Gaiellaceae bacterium]|nr:hypothetical protein [Gaiellaceae bacterium]
MRSTPGDTIDPRGDELHRGGVHHHHDHVVVVVVERVNVLDAVRRGDGLA